MLPTTWLMLVVLCWWAWTFNVGIMAGVICSKVVDQLHIWDEIAVKNTTPTRWQLLRQRRAQPRDHLLPGPHGHSASQTAAAWCDGPRHPQEIRDARGGTELTVGVKDRLNATNWLIRNAEGERRLLSTRGARNTIKGLKQRDVQGRCRGLHRR